MILKVFPSGPLNTNAYFIMCEETKEAILIDPSPSSSLPLTKVIQELQAKPVGIFLTHSHWDHVADVKILKTRFQIPVSVHPEDREQLEKPGSDGLPLFFPIDAVISDHDLQEGELICFGTQAFRVIHTPGHSPGGVVFYFEKEKILISGDTLFKGSIGKVCFPSSQPEKMWESLKKLAKLPSDTKVYPGHGPSTTIKAENWLSNAEEIFG
ncbi:MAG: MBL fold metallo-hydrolase [Simkaniaceae bacterium]